MLVATAILMGLVAFPDFRATAEGQGSPPGSQPQSLPAPTLTPPLAAGPPADLNLLFTAQVAGWTEPCG